MQIKCCVCNNKHTIKELIECDFRFTNIIKKYLNIDLTHITPVKKRAKKYKCKHCGSDFHSLTNYKYHIEHNVCKKIKKEYKCTKCGRTFTCNRNLKNHIEFVVCEKKQNTALEQNTILEQKNYTNINSLSNSQNTTNIQTFNQQNIENQQNNVVINVNSSDDLKKVIEMLPFRDVCYKIPTKKYLEYVNNPDQAIKQFVKDYHLNPDKPERMNVLNTNRRDNRVKLFDFDEDFICRWQTKDKSKVLELLCDRGVNALFFAKTMLAAAGIKLDPKKETALNAKIKEYESSDKVKKRYVDMIGDLTYDYRDMVESNKKKIDTQLKQLANK